MTQDIDAGNRLDGKWVLPAASAKIVRAMCMKYGLRAEDVIDDVMVKHLEPLIDRREKASRIIKGESILTALRKGPLPISKLRTKSGVGVMSDDVFDARIEEMAASGAIILRRSKNGKGKIALLSGHLNSEPN